MNHLWVVSYDISDDKVRSTVRRLLSNHGKRVQYSVFECWLSHQAMESLRTRLAGYVAEEDSIRWYPLCRWCSKNIDWWGNGETAIDPQYYLV